MKVDWLPYLDELVEQSKRLNETNDCTVKAWSNVFDCKYDSAHTYLRKFGRTNRRGMKLSEIENALKSCTRSKIAFGPYSTKNRVTVKQFCSKHPVGRFYVCSRGHAFCIKDGVVHDWKLGPARQITFAARVYLDGEY